MAESNDVSGSCDTISRRVSLPRHRSARQLQDDQDRSATMIQSMLQGTTIPVLEQVISFAQARHNVLAGNIANLDTPGYRVRDLSVDTFQQRLAEAVEASRQPRSPVTPGVLTDNPDEEMRRVAESAKTILFHDGSDVGLEQQVTEITKNQMMHNLAVSILSSQFRLLQSVIAERV